MFFGLTKVCDELGSLAQALEIQETRQRGWRNCVFWESVICPTHRDGGMMTIRQTNNEIRICTSPNANQLNLLTAKRMVGMEDSYKSRRGVGRTGSVLWVFRPC
jgi:hypothetical protein